MTIVILTCANCEKELQVEGEEFLQMRKEGLILNPSHRGRKKLFECCQKGTKKAPSRGKEPKAESTKSKKPTKTTDDRHKKNSAKESKSSGAKLTSSGIYSVESTKFPSAIDVEGREFVCIMHYTDRVTKIVSEKLNAMKVDTVVASNGASTSVYADAKTFQYVHFRMPRTGNVIVYKDKSVIPPKEMQIPAGKGKTVAVKYLFRKRGTVDEIFDEIFKRKIEASGIYKFKVFGLNGRYLVKTFDIYTDVVQPKPRAPKLSADYKKWCELHKNDLISDPHCSDCQNKKCPESAASGGICGDDACPSGFRM